MESHLQSVTPLRSLKCFPPLDGTVVGKLMLVHLTHIGVVLVQEPVRQSHAVVHPLSVAGVLL